MRVLSAPNGHISTPACSGPRQITVYICQKRYNTYKAGEVEGASAVEDTQADPLPEYLEVEV
jgi:hypothetical protein